MANERNTENIVQRHFSSDAHEGLIIEAQQSKNNLIQSLLTGKGNGKGASKRGNGVGRPEFIITSPAHPSVVLVVECKAEPKKHESPNRDLAADYAVDGVLHYARVLSKGFDVIALAVSGETEEELLVSTFKVPRGSSEGVELVDTNGSPVNWLASYDNLMRWFEFDPKVKLARHKDLMSSAKKLHNFLRDVAGCTEEQKPLLISACLIALKDNSFRMSYAEASHTKLPKAILNSVEDQLSEPMSTNGEKMKAAMEPYGFIGSSYDLRRPMKDMSTSPLHEILYRLERDVVPYLTTYGDADILGAFYGEFLRYTAGDGKGLGIVLTPDHITALFSDLAEVTPNSVVLDPCTGTGGFLIAAMSRMLGQAKGDPEIEATIKSQGLVGVEKQAHMFALAASNMFLRGDGRSNIYLGSSLDDSMQKRITSGERHPQPNVGFINPPYSMKQPEQSELHFIEEMLDMLAPNSIGIAIVPMSVGIKNSPVKGAILKKHSLEAGLSMPDELFYPVGTVTQILVFRAHVPHNADKPTWFGYWKNDGFVKTKDRGRIDLNGSWAAIRNQWLDDYRSKSERAGACVKRKVTAADEWCAEAYLETDYSALTEDDFARSLKKYALFLLSSSDGLDENFREPEVSG